MGELRENADRGRGVSSDADVRNNGDTVEHFKDAGMHAAATELGVCRCWLNYRVHALLCYFYASAKEEDMLSLFVCLLVCLLAGLGENYSTGFQKKISEKGSMWAKEKQLDNPCLDSRPRIT